MLRRERRSIRLPEYDYASAGAYFVTICTHRRECLFGEIQEGKVFLSALGQVVWQCWTRLPRHFPALLLDEFVIMPDHIHGVLVLTDAEITMQGGNGTCPGSLGAIVQNFKAISTRRVNQVRGATGAALWQRNYYERIIRHEAEWERIREYILQNPARWQNTPNL